MPDGFTNSTSTYSRVVNPSHLAALLYFFPSVSAAASRIALSPGLTVARIQVVPPGGLQSPAMPPCGNRCVRCELLPLSTEMTLYSPDGEFECPAMWTLRGEASRLTGKLDPFWRSAG